MLLLHIITESFLCSSQPYRVRIPALTWLTRCILLKVQSPLFKYDKYPFPAGEFTGFEAPMVMTMAVDGDSSVKAGDSTTFDVTITYKDQRILLLTLTKLLYTLFNSDMVRSWPLALLNICVWWPYTITLGSDVTSKLLEGTAKLSVAAASKVVSLPTFETGRICPLPNDNFLGTL